MRDQPPATDLLEAIVAFLRDEVMPQLQGRVAFHTRVAANALEIVSRELAIGPAADARESTRLAALLGHHGTLSDLNRELCAHIAAGQIDPADPALISHLWATTLDALAIDQPGYATYRRETESADK